MVNTICNHYGAQTSAYYYELYTTLYEKIHCYQSLIQMYIFLASELIVYAHLETQSMCGSEGIQSLVQGYSGRWM